MSWLSRFRDAWQTSMADGDQATSKYEQTTAVLGGWTGPVTVAGSQNVMVGHGTTQENTFVFGPGDEEPPDGWDPGGEVDDEGGMSDFDPRADQVAREEAAHFWPELGQ